MRLKKINNLLYGVLMLFPLLAIGVTCAYSVFNKNAKDSYYENSNITYLNNTNNINYNNYYYFTISSKINELTTSFSATACYIDVNIIDVITNTTNNSFTNITRIGFYSESSTSTIYYYFGNPTNWNIFSVDSIYNKITLKISIIDTLSLNPLLSNSNCIYSINGNYSLNNAFYNACAELNNQPVFNWVEDSIIYEPIQSLTSVFNIGEPFVLLFSYWITISCIWVIIDCLLLLVTFTRGLINRCVNLGD